LRLWRKGLALGRLADLKPKGQEVPAPASRQKRALAAFERVLLALGGGTGFSLSDTVSPSLEEEYTSRGLYQSKALVALVVALYFMMICLGLSYVRWLMDTGSPVTYYACHGVGAMEGHDAVSFLSAFNHPPRQVLLQVTGLLPPEQPTDEVDEDEAPQIAFNFGLDLSSWVVREEWSLGCSPDGEDSAGRREPLLAGIQAEELERLQRFLEADTNDLAAVVLHKHVVWAHWEDVATNIKQQIKQSGFSGDLVIRCEPTESVKVLKNRPWANFMIHRSVPVFCMLSLVGWPIYMLYMCLRCTELSIDSRFRVDVQAEDFWDLVSDQLGASGFDVTASGTGGSTGGSAS